MSPLFFAVTCLPSGHCAEEFLGALDDEEFFVVEGSGWRGRREFDSWVTCHPNYVHALCVHTDRDMFATHWSEPQPPQPPRPPQPPHWRLGSQVLRALHAHPRWFLLVVPLFVAVTDG